MSLCLMQHCCFSNQYDKFSLANEAPGSHIPRIASPILGWVPGELPGLLVAESIGRALG